MQLARRAPVHFLGIGGAGMAPLAELLVRAGGNVTGCDAHPNAATASLSALGVEVYSGHDREHIRDCSAVIVTAAVSLDHPELLAARDGGLPVLKRAAALGAVVNRGQVVGIAGTHGKTTTTTLTTGVLAAAGLDPTGLVGGRVSAWRSNLRPGSSDLFVVEADEYDRSFLSLRPSVAVVTTLEADHLDIFHDLQGVEDAFAAFCEAVPDSGVLIGCGDDSGVGRLLARLADRKTRRVTYGLNAGNMIRAEKVAYAGATSRFTVRARGRVVGEAILAMPGVHSVRNALAAVATALELGAVWADIARGLADFRGISRRFELLGETAGIQFVDDYAHHPTEIASTLAAARGAFPGRRLVAVFQPHLYTRTRDFAPAFGRALAAADVAVVTDVYAAREAPIDGVSGKLIADFAASHGAEVEYFPDRRTLAVEVRGMLNAGDVCLTLGAGDLDRMANELIATIGARG